MTAFLLVGLGGLLGANARYWITTWAARRWGTAFPYGTLLINVSGSFALGVFLPVVTARLGEAEGADARLLIATGFLGAYTTFSTFAFEAVGLDREGRPGRAILYAIGSAALGIAAAAAGIGLGARLGG